MLPGNRKNSLTGILDDVFESDLPDVFGSMRGVNMPAVNVVENENNYTIEVAAPGLNKEDFNVSLDDGVLTVSSEKEQKDEDEQGDFKRREFSYTSFKRSFNLPSNVDEENIKAEHENGVLYLIMPKKEGYEESERRSIEVK
ncbi:MAG: Hsp20/alpha crystallin family protein [Bacteroidales bacterium]|nr:Hsp20/alpha crystallin family protein [Bacteroidales bacterium]MBS3775902.1 Hsp20/alpha crystallin family protein [Bacteroidales bacterium]